MILKKKLIDILFFPIIHIIIEYLEDNGRCICNHFENDRFHFARSNKEIWEYMSKYQLLPKLYRMKKIPSKVSAFFIHPYLCVKHHIGKSSLLPSVNTLMCLITHLLKEKNKTLNESENKCHTITEGELYFIQRLRIYDTKVFMHCTTFEDTELLKSFIERCCIDVFLTGNSCCSGKGFAIQLYKSS